MQDDAPGKGVVYIVGGGPGDPGLITVKGLQCVRTADVIVYDRLIGEELLGAARPDAELIYCGKRPDHHALKQDEINQLLVEKAQEGKTVCRLKGGDPFVFGRGGEEAQALSRHGLAFEIVPGVSSAVAAGAYAGIPVTHRGTAASFAVVTGHEDPTKTKSQVDWGRLAGATDTLVILMGVGQLPQIVDELIAGGRAPDTPVALVARGTRPDQRTLVSTLGSVSDDARTEGVQPPAVVIVGDVVSLRPELQWFGNGPLSGRRVLVTRTREQASELSRLLRRYGATPVEMPVIQIDPPDDWEPLDAAVAEADGYDWVVFTSVNGVRSVTERLAQLGGDVRALKGPRVAAIGPKTAEAAERAGLRVSVCPDEYVAEALAEALRAEGLSGKRILLLRAAEARSTFPDEARKLGAEVTVAAAYQTRPVDQPDPRAMARLEQGEIDVVTFASSSSVRNFAAAVGAEKARTLLEPTCVACIGPITADTASGLGLAASVVPEEYTIEALVEAIAVHLAT